MAGSRGARAISALAPEPGPREIVLPKRVYGARITTADALTQEALAKPIETSI
jgi:hypothetical protein